MPKSVIAIDFDDTLFYYNHLPDPEMDFPCRPGAIGDPIWEVINLAKLRRKEGAKLILWTCREGKALALAVEACNGVGLFFDAINMNLQEQIDSKVWPNCRKVKADEYWDDKAKSIKELWEETREGRS